MQEEIPSQELPADEAAAPWLSIPEAATALGCSTDTVRRRLKRGEFESRQVPTRHGLAWQLRIGILPSLADGSAGTPMQAAESPAMVELVQLVGRLQEENRNLAGQLGYKEAQLQSAQETIRALQAQNTPPAPPEDTLKPSEPVEPLPTLEQPLSPWNRFVRWIRA